MPKELYRNYGFELERNLQPVAVLLPPEQEAVVGSIVKLDGTASIDPEDKGLVYKWRFSQVPIGSQVERFGFTSLETDSSIVSFAPDITGPYVVELTVFDGSLTSDPALANVDVRIILVPYHKGVIPDASFIWNYLSDFWHKVDGRRKFETFWSSAIQIAAAETLKLYQYDYNKSIRDIQDVFQRRWLSFEPGLVLDKTKVEFILAEDQAGVAASTLTFNPKTGVSNLTQPGYTNQVAVPFTEGHFGLTSFGSKVRVGRVLSLGDKSYALTRANFFTLSVANDEDGSVDSGTNVFHGNGFDDDMVGYTLRVLGSVNGVSKDWKIASVVSNTEVHLVTTDGTTPSFAEDVENLVYTVLPVKETHSVFVADRLEVSAGMDGLPWRFGSTLISSEHNYEAEGVSPGDLLEVEITRPELGLASLFYAQVTGVSLNRLSFVLNVEDLVDGVAGGGLTTDMQAGLAADLKVNGLAATFDGSFIYTDEAGAVNSAVRSLNFKRTYYEKSLTPFDEIDVGAFKIQARPVRILRNRKIPVDERLVSVPVLQEYVKQPQLVRDKGKLVQVTAEGRYELSREPYVLVENLDYVVDDEAQIVGSCELTAGVDEIKVPFGDLFDRSVQEQDVLEVTVGYTTQKFEIRRVLSSDLIRVYPTPNDTTVGVPFKLTRKLKGKYVRFIGSRFTKKNPAPKRLWAEVCYFDNNETIEDNFGVLVGLTREDIEKANADAPYKSAVAGLMYALTHGPTISNLKLAGQILLGMPFTQAAGVIKEINPNYRLREDGSTRFGRLLVEGRDKDNKATGLTYIYLYPQGRQLFSESLDKWISAVSDYSGLGVNPETGKEFKVGDVVGQFVPLSKGIDIREYIITPEWTAQLLEQGNIQAFLKQYHSFQLVVNSDLVSASDIDLAAQFLKRAKAHYVRLLAALLKVMEEIITIDDRLSFGRRMLFYDNPGQGLPSAIKVDDGDENQALVTLEGNIYTQYQRGRDLVTTQGSRIIVSASGGLLYPRSAFAEAWDPPLTKPGDLLVIEDDVNGGRYRIEEVTDDSTLVLEDDGTDFVTKSEQIFAVYRPLRNPIWSGPVSVTTGDGIVSTQEAVGTVSGIGSAGVMVGDSLIFVSQDELNPTISHVYKIVHVAPELVNPFVVVIPDPVEVTGPYTAWVIRNALMTRGALKLPYSDDPKFWGTTEPSAGRYFQFEDLGLHLNSWHNIALLRFGDILRMDGITHQVHYFDPATKRAYVQPYFTGVHEDVEVEIELRPERGTTPISAYFLDRVPEDFMRFEVQPSGSERAVTTSGTPDVVSSLGTDFYTAFDASPGDLFMLLDGPDSARDTQNLGAGIFQIREVLSGGTIIRLFSNLTASGTFTYAIRRSTNHER